MRVLFTSHVGDIWGAERSLLELIQQVRFHGVEPYLACPIDSLLASEGRKIGVSIVPTEVRPLTRRGAPHRRILDAVGISRATLALLGPIRRHRIDLLHSNTTLAQLWTGPAGILARVPCVWHWRDFYDLPRLNRTLSRMSRVSIAISDAIFRFAAVQLRSQERLVLARNGVEDRWSSLCTSSSDSWRLARGMVPSDVVVTLVGQPILRKGHEVLVRAIAQALGAQPRLRAVIAHRRVDAECSYLCRLRDLCRTLGCADRIMFVGSEDVASLLHASDIVMVPSAREPFGRIAVEGMLAERPVIASDVDALSEIVYQGETGLLVPPEPRRLAEAILLLASDPEQRRRMGRQGRRRALADFSMSNAAGEILAVYRHVLGRQPFSWRPRPRSRSALPQQVAGFEADPPLE